MTLHLSQIFFTDARTFITQPSAVSRQLTQDHLYRYTIRPRFRSYGDNSTATLSPGRMRIKFLRILPDTCASTWCLFSSSTLNIAFGRGSITTAITSIASSLLMHSLSSRFPVLSVCTPVQLRTENRELLSSLCQNHRPVFRYRYAMLEVRAVTAVCGHRGPLVAQYARFRLAEIH